MNWNKPFIEYVKVNNETVAVFGQHFPGQKLEVWELYKDNLENMIAGYEEDKEECNILKDVLKNWPVTEQ
jgi:hypothetical protein